MLQLFVSYDCGMMYRLERQAAELAELQPRLDQLDGQYLRWYVADEHGEPVPKVACRIHREILASLAAVRCAEAPDGG